MMNLLNSPWKSQLERFFNKVSYDVQESLSISYSVEFVRIPQEFQIIQRRVILLLINRFAKVIELLNDRRWDLTRYFGPMYLTHNTFMCIYMYICPAHDN